MDYSSEIVNLKTEVNNYLHTGVLNKDRTVVKIMADIACVIGKISHEIELIRTIMVITPSPEDCRKHQVDIDKKDNQLDELLDLMSKIDT